MLFIFIVRKEVRNSWQNVVKEFIYTMKIKQKKLIKKH